MAALICGLGGLIFECLGHVGTCGGYMVFLMEWEGSALFIYLFIFCFLLEHVVEPCGCGGGWMLS